MTKGDDDSEISVALASIIDGLEEEDYVGYSKWFVVEYEDQETPSFRETLENPARLRKNEPVIASQDWVDGRQAARLLGLRAHHGQEADQTREVSL